MSRKSDNINVFISMCQQEPQNPVDTAHTVFVCTNNVYVKVFFGGEKKKETAFSGSLLEFRGMVDNGVRVLNVNW